MFEKAKGKPEPNPKCWRCRMKEERNKEKMKINESQRERIFTEWQSPLREWLRPVSEWQRPMADWQRPLLSWYVIMSSYIMSSFLLCYVMSCYVRYVSDDTKVTMNQLALGPDMRNKRQRSGRQEDLEETVMMWYCIHFIFHNVQLTWNKYLTQASVKVLVWKFLDSISTQG